MGILALAEGPWRHNITVDSNSVILHCNFNFTICSVDSS